MSSLRPTGFVCKLTFLLILCSGFKVEHINRSVMMAKGSKPDVTLFQLISVLSPFCRYAAAPTALICRSS